MTRGHQRDEARERNQKKEASQGHKREGGGKVGASNSDADALQKKVEAKKLLIEQGLFVEKPKSTKEKPKNYVNPHTGKADPEWTKKMQNLGL
jgi:hypothetical protein